MNSYLAKTANCDVVQSPVSFESPEKTLNRATPIVGSLPFLGFGEQCFLVGGIYLDNWFSPVLMFNDESQLLAAVASITNDVVRIESTTSISRLGENTGGNTDIAQTSTRDIGSYSENRLID